MVTYQDLLRTLDAGAPFAFSRWGDGEWSCVLGHDGANVDGHCYTPTLQADLIDVLRRRPTYLLGMQPLVQRMALGADVQAWLQTEHLDALAWVDADVWHQASIRDDLRPWLDILRRRGVILVGPPRVQMGVPELVPVSVAVTVPVDQCHTAIDETTAQVIAALARYPMAVCTISASMSANVLIDRVAAVCPAATLLDVGSLWDPYIGFITRHYHRAVRRRWLAQLAPAS